jgi:hypothetical protein
MKEKKKSIINAMVNVRFHSFKIHNEIEKSNNNRINLDSFLRN